MNILINLRIYTPATKSSHYYLLIVHVNKSDWLVQQFVGFRDIAVPAVWRLFKTIKRIISSLLAE